MSDASPQAADPDVVAAMREVFAAAAAARATPEGDPGSVLDESLWSRLDDLGFARLTWPEESGGSGAGWLEGVALLTEAVRHDVSLPLAEHDLLAGWLQQATGFRARGPGRRAVAVLDESGSAEDVPWARHAASLLVLRPGPDGWLLAEVAAESVVSPRGANLLGEPRDAVRADISEGVAVDGEVAEGLFLRGALSRAVQVCAALERIVELTVRHLGEREQFGRPLARFQSVQHAVALMAAEAALARAATDAAALAAPAGSGHAEPLFAFRVAVARSCAARATTVVTRTGHQLHGAIGTTREHPLHRASLGALAWRGEYGDPASWDARVAAAARAAGPEHLWELIAAEPEIAGQR